MSRTATTASAALLLALAGCGHEVGCEEFTVEAGEWDDEVLVVTYGGHGRVTGPDVVVP